MTSNIKWREYLGPFEWQESLACTYFIMSWCCTVIRMCPHPWTSECKANIIKQCSCSVIVIPPFGNVRCHTFQDLALTNKFNMQIHDTKWYCWIVLITRFSGIHFVWYTSYKLNYCWSKLNLGKCIALHSHTEYKLVPSLLPSRQECWAYFYLRLFLLKEYNLVQSPF